MPNKWLFKAHLEKKTVISIFGEGQRDLDWLMAFLALQSECQNRVQPCFIRPCLPSAIFWLKNRFVFHSNQMGKWLSSSCMYVRVIRGVATQIINIVKLKKNRNCSGWNFGSDLRILNVDKVCPMLCVCVCEWERGSEGVSEWVSECVSVV